MSLSLPRRPTLFLLLGLLVCGAASFAALRGADVPLRGITTSLTDPRCGDGRKEGAEECDDGNAVSGDGCVNCSIENGWRLCPSGRLSNVSSPLPPALCEGRVGSCNTTFSCSAFWDALNVCRRVNYLNTRCSPGFLQSGGPCGTTSCAGECYKCTQCGDHILDQGETCDDGGTLNADGCSSTCQIEQPPVLSSIAISGQNVIVTYSNPFSQELCASLCAGSTRLHTKPLFCENLGMNVTYPLSDLPLLSVSAASQGVRLCVGRTDLCGDTAVCGEPIALSQPPPICGNIRVEEGEACDDGNKVDGDGCSKTCSVETGWICEGTTYSRCVQQIPTLTSAEIIGQNVAVTYSKDFDGCVSLFRGVYQETLLDWEWFPVHPQASFFCERGADLAVTLPLTDPPVTAGMSLRLCRDDNPTICSGTSNHVTIALWCGNRTVERLEQCDDGNIADGDGCSASCQVEPGWECHKGPTNTFSLCQRPPVLSRVMINGTTVTITYTSFMANGYFYLYAADRRLNWVAFGQGTDISYTRPLSEFSVTGGQQVKLCDSIGNNCSNSVTVTQTTASSSLSSSRSSAMSSSRSSSSLSSSSSSPESWTSCAGTDFCSVSRTGGQCTPLDVSLCGSGYSRLCNNSPCGSASCTGQCCRCVAVSSSSSSSSRSSSSDFACPAPSIPSCPGGVLFPQLGRDANGCARPPVCCAGAASGGQCTTNMSCTNGTCVVDSCNCQ